MTTQELVSPDLWRASWGLVVPSANTATEADFWRSAPHGITFHAARVLSPARDEGEDEREYLERFGEQIYTEDGRAVYRTAVESLLTMNPSRIVFPISAVTMRHGLASADTLKADFEKWSGGVPVTLGGHAILHALQAVEARKVALFSPYLPAVQQRVIDYLEEGGFEVVRFRSIALGGAEEILKSLRPDGALAILRELDHPDVDVIIQSGANMSMLGLIDQLEQEIGKPFLPMNPTVLWSALRTSGYNDRLTRFGTLWRDH